MNLEEIRKLLEPLDHTTLECDGLTRIAANYLDKAGVFHLIFIGEISCPARNYRFSPHYWLVLKHEGRDVLIDYRARLWLGESSQEAGNQVTIPHGVFDPEEFPDVQYNGIRSAVSPLTDRVCDLMLLVNRIKT